MSKGKYGAMSYARLTPKQRKDLNQYKKKMEKVLHPPCKVCGKKLSYGKKWCTDCSYEILEIRKKDPSLTIAQCSKRLKATRQTSLD